MADQQSIVTLNIGSQRVAMGVFAVSKGGELILNKYAATSILADPATEAARKPQIELAIKELAQSLKVKKLKACYALSGQTVLNRFVKLPPLDEENIDELVRFEAQQVFPFPIDEVIWDWEVLQGNDLEKEVILVAIKGDSLNETSETVNECGLGTELVDSSPTALYNALRYNYPDLEECTMLLDIGAKSSNLVYVDGPQFFTRSISIGGSSLTSAIAKDYNLSFPEAENTKLTSGLVSLGGGHTAQLDEATAALGTLIRNSLSRLNAQISQTTTLFRTQHGGSAPKKILLAGGGANLPYIKEFLEEKLKLPVEPFNALRRVSVGKKVDVDTVSREAHLCGELVGLAVRRTGKAAINIDLVPEAVGAERDINRRKPLLITAAACLLGGLAIWSGMKFLDADSSGTHLKKLSEREAELKGPGSIISDLDQKNKKMVETLGKYNDLETARKSYIAILDQISSDFAHDEVWLTDITPISGYTKDKDKIKPLVKGVLDEKSYGKSNVNLKSSDGKFFEANAIKISGLWRKDSADVYKIIKKIRNNKNSLFTFKGIEVTTKRKREIINEVDLQDSDLITMKIQKADGFYAAPFTLFLPLKKPIQIR